MGEILNVGPVKGNEPLSSQVYTYLLELLDRGIFKPGSKLPSENDLSRSLNVSRVSLRETLQRLELEGYIERKRGVGTFVIDRHPKHAEAGIEKLVSMSEVIRYRGSEPGTRETKIFSEIASADIAARLHLEEGDPVTVIDRIRTIDGKPAFYDSNRFPATYFPPTITTEKVGDSLFSFVEQKLGLFISHAVARLLPERVDEVMAQRLEIPEGSLLIKLDQVHYLTDNTPVWHSILSYPESEFSWYVVRTR